MLLDNLLTSKLNGPGSVHDARVFANCEVQKRNSEGKLKLFHKELLPGRECGSPSLISRSSLSSPTSCYERVR